MRYFVNFFFFSSRYFILMICGVYVLYFATYKKAHGTIILIDLRGECTVI